MHLTIVATLPVFNPRLTLPIALLLATTVGMTLSAVFALERDERRQYLLTRRRAHLHEDLALVRQRLETLSHTDALTGAYNRLHLQEHVQQVWRRAQHDGADVSIIMLDVDHFKRYNDQYGHPAGDRCLVQVARAMNDCVRPTDVVARFGGEEFIAVLSQADAATAGQVAERMRVAIQALDIRHADSDVATVVTASLGVASVRARADLGHAALISAADAALYRAKQAGRNRVAVGFNDWAATSYKSNS